MHAETQYFEAYNETDAAMDTVAGLAVALNGLLSDWEELASATPASLALRALGAVLAEKAQALPAIHEAEWDAAGKERTAKAA